MQVTLNLMKYNWSPLITSRMVQVLMHYLFKGGKVAQKREREKERKEEKRRKGK